MQERCLECFSLLSIKTRFAIFNFLNREKKGVKVGDLVNLTGLTQPTVTYHIKRLVKVGIVKKKKMGRQVCCLVCKKCDNCPLFF